MNYEELSQKSSYGKVYHGLLIAEKPDLMRRIEEVYDDHISEIPYTLSFASQRGHLLTLLSPDEMDEDQKNWRWETLPFNPEDHGGWKYKVISEKKTGSYLTSQERYDNIKKEISSGKYDFVVNAGDPDQEGELLVRIVLEHIGNKLPVMRFWTNDLTETHILNALKTLRDDDNDPMLVNLKNAAFGRQHSDYRVGMNVSRAATLKMNGRVACGRVKTPILAIVCRREDEIENFVPRTSYGVVANYEEGITGSLYDPGSTEEEESEDKKGIIWFDNKRDAEDIIAKLSKKAKVIFFEEKEEKTYAPKQFKLATLQIEAGKHGYSDGNTLRIVQKLYEKKLLSYPRTDCEYLSSDEDFMGILKVLRDVGTTADFVKNITRGDLERVKKSEKWINDNALEESGHSAIRPTTSVPDYSELDKDEIFIYEMVCKRFVSMFLPPLIQMKTVIITDIDGYQFRSSGKRLIDLGFEKIFGTKYTDSVMPHKDLGDEMDVKEYQVSEKKAQCPKHLTSPEIIAICENPAKYLEDKSLKTSLGKSLKLGTPATRSPIIEQLIERDKYLEIKKEGKRTVVVPTPLGRMIIKNLGPCDICKIDMTGEWELKLEDIRCGRMSLELFEEQMKEYVLNLIKDIKSNPMTPFLSKSVLKTVGVCPVCGKEIVESEKGFSCKGYMKDGTGCNIKLWKSKYNAVFDIKDAMELWNGNSIEKTVVIGGVTMEKQFEYDFSAFDIKLADEVRKTAGVCPACGGNITAGSIDFKCEGCDVKGSRFVCGAELSDDHLKSLFVGDKVSVECKKEDKEWTQQIYFDKTSKKIEFYSGEKSKYDCPCCKKTQLIDSEKAFRCLGCKFTFWKTTAGHTFTEEETEKFMKEGKTPEVEFTGKKGPFKACLALDKKKKATKFEFEKG